MAHGQGEHERRPAALVDRAHHRGEVVGAAGGDLDRAHRAGPHRPAVLEPAIRRRAGAVLVRDHPERRAAVGAADLVAALLDPLQLRDPAELAAAGPAVPATGLGTLLTLPLDGLGTLARTTSTPRAAAVGGVVLAAAASGSKSCYPFTENPPAHRAPPAVRAGAGAPAVAGPSGPATLSLLTSSRAARPAPGPATTASDSERPGPRRRPGAGRGLRRPGAPPWTQGTDLRRAPTSDELGGGGVVVVGAGPHPRRRARGLPDRPHSRKRHQAAHAPAIEDTGRLHPHERPGRAEPAPPRERPWRRRW